MTDRHDNNNDFDFDKDIQIDVDLEFDVDVDIEFDKDVDIYGDICWDVDVQGNTAMLTLDAEAVGKDTLVEVDAVVLTIEDELSSITLSVVSAID